MDTLGIWLIVAILIYKLYLDHWYVPKTDNENEEANKNEVQIVNEPATISPSLGIEDRPRMLRVYTDDGMYLFDRPENSLDVKMLVGSNFRMVYRDTGETYNEPSKSN